MTLHRVGRAGMAACLALGSMAVQAQLLPDRGLIATLNFAATYESNIFRLPDGTTPADLGLPSDQRSDWILAPGASLSGRFGYGLQEFSGDVRLSWNRFETFDNYNSDILSYGLTWKWRTAGNFDGVLTVGQDESNTGFEDFLGATVNQLTVDRQVAVANWRPRPDRRFTAGLDRWEGKNSLEARHVNDFVVTNARVTAAWTSPLSNEIYVNYFRTDGEYPNRVPSELFAIDNNFKQDNWFLGTTWNPGPDTQLDARVGYLSRRYDQFSARDFASPAWYLNLHKAVGSRTLLSLEFARDANSIDDLDRTYTLSTRANVSLAYSLSAKTRATVQYDWERVAWDGDPLTAVAEFLQLVQDPRVDRYTAPLVALEWFVTPRWTVSVAQQWLKRESNRDNVEYRSNVTQFSVSYTLGP